MAAATHPSSTRSRAVDLDYEGLLTTYAKTPHGSRCYRRVRACGTDRGCVVCLSCGGERLGGLTRPTCHRGWVFALLMASLRVAGSSVDATHRPTDQPLIWKDRLIWLTLNH